MSSKRRKRTKYTDHQLKILVQLFRYQPYPDYPMRQYLALELGIEEPRIQVWFQNRRARLRARKRSQPEDFEGNQDEDQPMELSVFQQDYWGGEARWNQTSFTSTQLQTLILAFETNPFPGIESRKQLSEAIGLPESEIQTWFQNRRYDLNVWKNIKPNEFVAQKEG